MTPSPKRVILTPGVQVMNQVPVKLEQFAETVGEIDYWWVTTTFVEHPELKMMAFSRHHFYKPLHGGNL